MGNSNLTQSLDNVDGFIHSSQYPSQMNILESEWGSVKNVRFLLSSIGSTTPNGSFLGNTVYNTFVAGMESYGFVRQDRESAHFIYLPPEIAGGNLALNASLGWKTRNAQEILNDAWVKINAHFKSLLIGLELWFTDNKAEGNNHRERLNEENSLCGYAIV